MHEHLVSAWAEIDQRIRAGEFELRCIHPHICTELRSIDGVTPVPLVTGAVSYYVVGMSQDLLRARERQLERAWARRSN